MDYDLYTTDDRRYARVIQPDDGEPLSGSSYAGSDASNAPGHSQADVAKAGEIEHSSQPIAQAEATITGDGEPRIHVTESGIGTIPAPRRSHDPLVPTYHGITSPSSGISRQDVLGQEQDQISEIVRHLSATTVTEDDRATRESITAGDSRRRGQEEVGDATTEASGPSEHGLGAGPLSQNDHTHSAPGNGIYSELGTGIYLLDNDNSASERRVPNRDVGRGSQARSSRRTTLPAGSDISGRQSPPPERARSNSINSNRNIREIILPRWQPDAEVTYCPICRTQFSFFVRKHHCRYAANSRLSSF
jgi:hypothetical protein